MKRREIKRSAPCVFCNSYNSSLLYTKSDGKYVKCTSCGLVSVDPLPTFEEMVNRSEFWAEEHHKKNIKVNQHFSNDFRNFVYKEYFQYMDSYKINNRVLDIGCGIGSFVYAAEKEGWETYGIDVGPAITIAEKYKLNVSKGRIEDMNFPNNYFDVITMFDVIEHIIDLDSLMVEVRNCLRDDGLLIVKTPNISSLTSLLLRNEWSSVQPKDHITLFSKKTLTAFLRKYQFKIIADKTIDINFFELKNNMAWRRNKDNYDSTENSKREFIDKIIEKKFLEKLRNIINYFLNIFGFGESIIVYAVKKSL